MGAKNLVAYTLGDFVKEEIADFLRMAQPSLTEQDLSNENVNKIYEVCHGCLHACDHVCEVIPSPLLVMGLGRLQCTACQTNLYSHVEAARVRAHRQYMQNDSTCIHVQEL